MSDILGSIVTAKAGRDKGRSFAIVAAVDSEYVLLADGCTRKIEKPKKKKRKHIRVEKDKLNLCGLPNDAGSANAYIRRALGELGYNKKTGLEEG